jgi:RNA polymerase sigma-70 factor (ECF subfamily)
MPKTFELASIFCLEREGVLATLPGGMAQLEQLLRRAWDAGRAQWPDISLSAETFVRHLARHWPSPSEAVSTEQQFEQFKSAEFYLTCACVQRIPGAFEAIERHYLVKLPETLTTLNLPPARLEDLCQEVCIKLLTSPPGALLKIAEYSGRGALFNWLKVVARRTAISLLRTDKETAEDNVSAIMSFIAAPGEDPELDLIKRKFRGPYRQALYEAFATLSRDQLYLLRLHFGEGLSTPVIALTLGVNQSTISRWLQSARQKIYEETKRRLKVRLQVNSQEFESIRRVLDRDLDISVHRILANAEPDPPDPIKIPKRRKIRA